MTSAILLPVPTPVLALVRAPVPAAFTVSVPPAVLMIGFIFYPLLAFRGPSPKFRFTSGVITGLSGAVLLPDFLFPHPLIVTRLCFRRVFLFELCRLGGHGLPGFFRPGLRKRASASYDKACEKCYG
jgi:hypothetical protein